MSSKQIVSADIEKGRLALKPGASMADVMKAMVTDTPVETKVPDFPPVPAPVVITDEVKKALRRLPDVFAEVQPTERRSLTDAENHALYEEREVLREITGLLVGRDEAIKEIARHHMDVTAEEAGLASPETTQRDTHGHYVLAAPQNPDRNNIDGTNMAWSREYRGGAVSSDPSVLLRMYEDGEISREVYLAMTREVRVFDEKKAVEMALKNKDLRDDILGVIRAMTKVGRPGTNLNVRKQK